MIPTLQRYLARDLIRTGALAAVSLTLLVTTFAVIEPLRKEGLDAGQALKLFWYLLPVMLSLTMPIAALFAATFTYGRFAMDNELTACRASGISRYRLLKPGIALGVAIGLLSLVLSNWIAPQLARQGQAMVIANVRGLFYQRLRTESYFTKGSWLLHADSVDPERHQLRGVVVVDAKDKDNVKFYTASSAVVDFSEADGGHTVTVSAIHPASGEQKGFLIYEMSQVPFGPFPVDEQLKEKESFYTWRELHDTLRDPEHSPAIQRRLWAIRRRLVAQAFYREMAASIDSGRVYELAHEDLYRYQFQAPSATVGTDRLVLNAGGEPDRPVIVKQYDMDGALYREFRSRTVELQVSSSSGDPWGRRSKVEPMISMTLTDLTIHQPELPDTEPIPKPEYSLGQLQMPPGIETSLTNADLETLYRHPERFPSVTSQLGELRRYIRQELHPGIVAEIHGRLAYGIGCILLVPIGAALGLIYRGGHILSAFALSCLPALVLIVMMIMGKQIIGNPDAGANAAAIGLAAIWSGVALLAGLTAYLYGVVLRR